LRLRLAGSLALSLGLAASVASPARADDWKKTFGDEHHFGSRNSWDKLEGVKMLDATQPDQLKMILKIAEGEDWFLRSACIDLLVKPAGESGGGSTKEGGGKGTDELRKILKAGKPANTAEVIAIAFGRSKDEGYTDDLVAALKNKSADWKVRRACAMSLGNIPSKKGIGALIDAFEIEEKAKNFALYVHMIEALERATQEKDKKSAADWKSWWSGAESSWGEKKDPKDEESAKSGEVIHTVSKGTDLTFRARGKGRPLLVLPEYGYEQDYLETYLRNLEETHQCLYMRLPGMKDFKDPELKAEGNLPAPVWPLNRMCDAFEEMRKSLIADKKIENKPFALFGHGLSGWLAIRYASLHPEGISRLVLCSVYPNGRAFDRDRKNMENAGKQTGDQELEHFAQSILFDQAKGKHLYEAASHEENLALERKSFSTYFGNWQDVEIERLLGPLIEKKGSPGKVYKVTRVDTGCFIPNDFDVTKEPEVGCPTLVIAGDKAYFGSPDDAADIQKHYPKSAIEIFKNCARMPFVEDNKHFTSVLEKFLH
jgi:pimeloyl-ACP methyl ester carboxylesterase